MSKIIEELRSCFARMHYSDAPFNNDSDSWNLACVAMDTIEDTALAIDYYERYSRGRSDGYKYLRLYGLLQAIFLQQNAIEFFYKVFSSDFNKYKDKQIAWENIRGIRNLSIGHPMDKSGGKRCYVVRASLNKKDFSCIVWDKIKKKDEYIDINLNQLMSDYKKEISLILKDILIILKRYLKK